MSKRFECKISRSKFFVVQKNGGVQGAGRDLMGTDGRGEEGSESSLHRSRINLGAQQQHYSLHVLTFLM